MATVTFDTATRTYPGTDHPAVNALDLTIADGEFLVMVGPSGCGKSTSLRMLAGLEEVDSGRVLIDEHDVTDVEPKDRDIAMVFQNYALYPHMSVADNMAFSLKLNRVSAPERRERVLAAAKMLDLEDFLDRKPKALSGGQRQRVAMGRAIVREPKVFLMDEPLSNLDAKLRIQTRSQIAELQRKLGVTTLYVTHDQTEALTMGDRIAVLKDGVLQQVGTPRELLNRPNNVFVAGFIGSPAMNLLPTRIRNNQLMVGDFSLKLTALQMQRSQSDEVVFGIRPEDIVIVEATEPGLDLQVQLVEEFGADGHLYGTARVEDTEVQVIVRVDGRNHPRPGERIRISFVSEHIHLFDAKTGRRLPS